jgi:hypothetical protein
VSASLTYDPSTSGRKSGARTLALEKAAALDMASSIVNTVSTPWLCKRPRTSSVTVAWDRPCVFVATDRIRGSAVKEVPAVCILVGLVLVFDTIAFGACLPWVWPWKAYPAVCPAFRGGLRADVGFRFAAGSSSVP